jgi:serine/threonine protein kinase
MRSDPRNRTVPLIDVIALTDGDVLLVMPYLRVFDTPWFHCRGEAIDALRQFLQVRYPSSITVYALTIILQGLQFMHEQNIAHRYHHSFNEMITFSCGHLVTLDLRIL